MKVMEHLRKIQEAMVRQNHLSDNDLQTILDAAKSPEITVKSAALIVLGQASSLGLYEGSSFEKLLIDEISDSTGTEAVILLKEYRNYKKIPPSRAESKPPGSGGAGTISPVERKWVEGQAAKLRGGDQQVIGEFFISKGKVDSDSLSWAKSMFEELNGSHTDKMSDYWQFVAKGFNSKQ